MIYIISEKKDLMTDLVIEWLLSGEKCFIRINNEDFTDTSVLLLNGVISNSSFMPTSVWHRRSQANVLPGELFLAYPNRDYMLHYLNKEANILLEFMEIQFRRSLGNRYIGSARQETNNNKLYNLTIAAEIGLRVPDTIVTSSKERLTDFYQTHKRIITKDLRAPVYIQTSKKAWVSTGVKLVDEPMIEKLNEHFAPVYAQACIDKKFEIRVFIACGRLYAMAVFSQSDQQTQVDFRNYNRQKANRCVPFQLPQSYEAKIWKFMKALDMNTGSIDLIVDKEGEYWFLEINPMGQFHWLSANCNYQIEKHIAQYIANE